MTAQQFRKKPVVIEAMQWDGTAAGATPIIDWMLASGVGASYRCDVQPCPSAASDAGHHISIQTLEGRMSAASGDYVIKGVAGEFYPCKPDIFAATYEAVEAAE